jgi:hypothetical protein
MTDIILKRFDSPDETRTFQKGKFEIVRLPGTTIGRATYPSTMIGGLASTARANPLVAQQPVRNALRR